MLCPDFPPRKPPEHHYQKHAGDIKKQGEHPDRGGCLSAFLALNIFANGLLLLVILGTFFALRANNRYAFDSGTQVLIYASFVILVARFISSIGLWNWKRWGYYGLMAGFGITIVLGLMSADFIDVIRSMSWGTILYFMVRPIESYLE